MRERGTARLLLAPIANWGARRVLAERTCLTELAQPSSAAPDRHPSTLPSAQKQNHTNPQVSSRIWSQHPPSRLPSKQGIAENWSRTGSRAVALSNGLKYDVITQVVEDPDGQNVELEWVE